VASVLPVELQREQERIERVAREMGLTFFRVIFEMVDWRQMNALAAYGGFPTRYPHWRWGMEYTELAKSYEYGLHKIYEMVINNDPTYAYLLEGNAMVDQKLVMAHVYGHADFFVNNVYFGHTDRKMIDAMANHATRVRRLQERQASKRSSGSSTPASRPRTSSIPAPCSARETAGRHPPTSLSRRIPGGSPRSRTSTAT